MIAFPGFQQDKQEYKILFCIIYVMQTWLNKIYDPETRNKMIQAMHKQTKISCKLFVQNQLIIVPSTLLKNILQEIIQKIHTMGTLGLLVFSVTFANNINEHFR